MNWNDLTGNERLVAEQAVLAYRAMAKAGSTAPHGQGMAALERVATSDGLESIRKMIELSASEHPEAQKKGSAASRARAAER